MSPTRPCRTTTLKLLTVAALAVLGTVPTSASAQGTVVVRTSRIVDGRGGVVLNRDIVIRDGRIAEIVAAGQGRGERVHDLTGYTVLPGLIDTHVHVGWHFGPDGRLDRGSEMPDRVLYGAENAHRMLIAGFTTVQSLGGLEDGPLARAFERGVLPGPRVITSLGQLSAGVGDPAEFRAAVLDLADRGARVIKLFGSESSGPEARRP